MAHLLDLLKERVLLCDGGMGSRVQMLDLDVERDYWGMENCTECLSCPGPTSSAKSTRLSRGRRRHGRDQHLRRLADHARRVRPRRQGVRDQQARRRAGARGGRELAGDGRQRFVARLGRPRHPLPSLGHVAYHAAGRRAHCPGARPDRRRCRCDPDRDLPGPAADQGRGQRRQGRAAAEAGTTLRSSSR